MDSNTFGGVARKQENKLPWTPATCPPGTWIKTESGAVLLVRKYTHPEGKMGLNWYAEVRAYQSYPGSIDVTTRLGKEETIKVPTITIQGEPYFIEIVPPPVGADEVASKTVPAEMRDSKVKDSPEEVFPPELPLDDIEKVLKKGKCPKHPQYKGKRPSKCIICQYIYEKNRGRNEVEKQTSILKKKYFRPRVAATGGYIVPIITRQGGTVSVTITELFSAFGRILEDFHLRLSTVEDKVNFPQVTNLIEVVEGEEENVVLDGQLPLGISFEEVEEDDLPLADELAGGNSK